MLVSYALSRKREASITGLYRVTKGSLEALLLDMAAVLTGSDAGQLRGASECSRPYLGVGPLRRPENCVRSTARSPVLASARSQSLLSRC